MAIPVLSKLVCPLCSNSFEARTMGASYFISGVDPDLRETGSIEDVRRYSIATCPDCRYSDYAWDFVGPDEFSRTERDRIKAALDAPDAPRRSGRRGRISDFDRFVLADRCFAARGLDASSCAELALLAYYVARDLGRGDLEPTLRDRACDLFEDALAGEDLPPALALRYAYVCGVLHRRAARLPQGLGFLEQAIKASRDVAIEEPSPEEVQGAIDLARLARQQQASILHQDDSVAKLEKLARDEDKDVAVEACRILGRRAGKGTHDAIKRLYRTLGTAERTALLRELVAAPPRELAPLFRSVLETSTLPEEVRLAARAIGTMGTPDQLEPLVLALERGLLSTEAAIVDAIRRLDSPGKFVALRRVLDQWEARSLRLAADDKEEAWRFASDVAPLKAILYTSGEAEGIDLLVRDLRGLEENDLWDKPPSGSPVPAALALGARGVPALRVLLRDKNPSTRRWVTWVLAELEAKDSLPDIERLVRDESRVVRLEAARAAARLSGRGAHEETVLVELRALDDADLPFALHFLVPFKSDRVRSFLLDVLEKGIATPGEVYPLLGRQDVDTKSRRLLESGLDDAADETRAGAVTGLAFFGAERAAKDGPVVSARLRALFEEEDQDDVRRRIVFGLTRLAERGVERDEALQFLLEHWNGTDRRLKFPAGLGLLQLGDTTGIEVVRERAALIDESADHYDLVAPALRALSAVGATPWNGVARGLAGSLVAPAPKRKPARSAARAAVRPAKRSAKRVAPVKRRAKA